MSDIHASQQNMDSTPELTLAQARMVIWQTQPKRPMGELLDEGLIGWKDLVWAAEKAYRADVKAAARILLAEFDKVKAARPAAPIASFAAPPARPAAFAVQPAAIEESVEPRYGPQVVVASQFLADTAETNMGALGIATGAAFVAGSLGIIDLIRSLLSGTQITAWSVVGLVVSIVIGVFAIGTYGRRWAAARRGQVGEERVTEALRQALDNRWTIYRNLQLPGRVDDLDLVLVGPGGVWAVQVKHFLNPLRFHAGHWEYKAGRRWRGVNKSHDPAKVAGQAQRLSEYLAKNGITRWVEKAIALAESVPEKNVADSPVAVWLPFTIERHARALSTRTPPSRAEVEQINALLAKRAGEQRAVEESKRQRGK